MSNPFLGDDASESEASRKKVALRSKEVDVHDAMTKVIKARRKAGKPRMKVRRPCKPLQILRRV